MEKIIVIFVLSILWIGIGLVETKRYWQSLLNILFFTIIFYVFFSFNLISNNYIADISLGSLSFFLFFLSFLSSLMQRISKTVKKKIDKNEEDDLDSKKEIKRETWGFYTLFMYWTIWAQVLTALIRMEISGLLVAFYSVVVAVILFIAWFKIGEHKPVLFSATLSIISVALFVHLLF
ncbi:MAG: hypothetical protein PF488_03820 [Patescibacteria group bacterium]|jgi:hypothetical protein|nr:hypothetical protein [Patescibacteria group bacterium]